MFAEIARSVALDATQQDAEEKINVELTSHMPNHNTSSGSSLKLVSARLTVRVASAKMYC